MGYLAKGKDFTDEQIATLLALATSGAATAALDNLSAVAINTALLPGTDNSIALGSSSKQWSDLFLGSGALLNFNNGNVVVTHSSGVLTVSTGDLRITTAGSDTASAVTVGGSQTLTNKTLSAPTLSGAMLLLENAQFQLDTALSADGTYCGITEVVTAGATIAFGDVVYLKAADSQWYLTDADADATAGAVRIAIAVSSGADNGSMTIMTYGKIRADAKFPDLTIGGPMYLDATTPGAIVAAQPSGTDDVIRIVGHGNTTNELFFNPSNDYITHT